MGLDPKPFKYVAPSGSAPDFPAAQPVTIYGLPTGGGVDPQPTVVVNESPADADEVAGDLKAVVDALVAAGVLTV